MQPLNRRIAGDDNIRVVAEPLQATIPNIAANILISARGQPQKFNVPHRSQPQLLCQASQVVSYINVPKGICETYGKLESSCAGQESLQRAAGAHSIAREKRRMPSLCPDKIVASVVCGSNNYVVRGQRFERSVESRTRQVWAVAVEGDDASLRAIREVRKHRSQACSKTFPLLRHHARSLACELRQLV